MPVMFVAGALLTSVIEGAVAGDALGQRRSFVADLVAMVVMSVLVLVPAARAWRLGHRAVLSGNRAGRWPRLVGAALAALAIGVIIASILNNSAQGLYAP